MGDAEDTPRMPRYDLRTRRAVLALYFAELERGASKTAAQGEVRAVFGVGSGTVRRWAQEEAEATSEGNQEAESGNRSGQWFDNFRRGGKWFWRSVTVVAVFVAGSLAAMASAIAVWDSPELKRSTCLRIDWVSSFCPPEYYPVSDAEAELVINEYFGRARNGSAPGAFAMLVTKSDQDEEEFVDDHLEVLWQEVVQAPLRPEVSQADGSLQAAARRNTFTVEVRRYEIDGSVDSLIYDVRLEARGNGDAAIVELNYTSYGEESLQVEYPWAVMPERVDTRLLPFVASGVNAPATKFRDGGQLRALCEIEVREGVNGAVTAEDVGWWTRTNQGWIRNADTATDGDPVGALACSDYVLSRTEARM